MKKAVAVGILIALAALTPISAAFAAPEKVGIMDPRKVLFSHPEYDATLRRIKGIADQKQRAEEEQKLMSPLFKDIDLAVRAVSNARRLTVVFDKTAMFYGGYDLTDDVVQQLKSGNFRGGPADTAEVRAGYIDQQAVLSQHPEYAAVERRVQSFIEKKQNEARIAISKETDENKKTEIYEAARKSSGDEEQKLMKPITDAIDLVIREVADAKNLTIVTGKNIVYYGGHDVTDDVTQWLKSGTLTNRGVSARAEERIGTIDPQKILFSHPKYDATLRRIKGIVDKKQNEAKIAIDKETDINKKAEIFQAARKSIAEEEQELMSPLFKDIDLAIRSVSNARRLTVVYDKSAFFYGGFDITDEVIKELKKYH